MCSIWINALCWNKDWLKVWFRSYPDHLPNSGQTSGCPSPNWKKMGKLFAEDDKQEGCWGCEACFGQNYGTVRAGWSEYAHWILQPFSHSALRIPATGCHALGRRLVVFSGAADRLGGETWRHWHQGSAARGPHTRRPPTHSASTRHCSVQLSVGSLQRLDEPEESLYHGRCRQKAT